MCKYGGVLSGSFIPQMVVIHEIFGMVKIKTLSMIVHERYVIALCDGF